MNLWAGFKSYILKPACCFLSLKAERVKMKKNSVLIAFISAIKIYLTSYLALLMPPLFYESSWKTVSRVDTVMIFVSLCVLLNFLCELDNNMKKSFIGATITSSIPAAVAGMMVFSQFHHIISTLIIISVIAIYFWGFFTEYVNVKSLGNMGMLKKIFVCHKSIFSFTCIVFVLFSVAPFFVGFSKEEERTEYNSEEIRETMLESAVPEVSDVFERYPVVIEDMKKWDSFNVQEKVELLSRVVCMESEYLGIAPEYIPDIVSQKDSIYIGGSFSKTDGKIYVNCLNMENMYNAIKTILHETFHAYEWYTVSSLDFESDIVKNGYYFITARQWEENYSSYIPSAIDHEAYSDQPVERDAFIYSEWRVLDYLEAAEIDFDELFK